MRYQIFSVFGPWGLTPGPKFTKRGDDLSDSEVYHPAKFHRSPPTHAQDIHYHVTKVLRTKKKTSTPVVRTGVYPHMPIAVTTVVKDTFVSVFSNTRYKILCMYSRRIFYDNSRHRLRHRTSPPNTNSLQHWPSPTMRRFVSHSTQGSRRSCKFVARANERRTCYRLFDF